MTAAHSELVQQSLARLGTPRAGAARVAAVRPGPARQPAAGTTERRWMTFPADEASVAPLVEVVEGLLVAGSNGLAGYPKTGKSLIATGLGRAIAGGMARYLGREVRMHGDVLHVYLEGTRGVPGRSRAFDVAYARSRTSRSSSARCRRAHPRCC